MDRIVIQLATNADNLISDKAFHWAFQTLEFQRLTTNYLLNSSIPQEKNCLNNLPEVSNESKALHLQRLTTCMESAQANLHKNQALYEKFLDKWNLFELEKHNETIICYQKNESFSEIEMCKEELTVKLIQERDKLIKDFSNFQS